MIFNIDEIIKMAIGLEKTGCAFYLEAAEKTESSELAILYRDLADMEQQHEAQFRLLQTTLQKTGFFSGNIDPDNEAALYLNSIVNAHVVFQKNVIEKTATAMLKQAIVTEKDSIVFYLGIKPMIPVDLGKSYIDQILREEMMHVRILSEALLKL